MRAFEIDGAPINVIEIVDDCIKGTADVRFSTGVMEYAGKIPVQAENHNMEVRWLHVMDL